MSSSSHILKDVSLAPSRLKFILISLQTKGAVRTRELADLLGVSEMTVRRDLSELEELGYLTRVHGGATTASLDVLRHGVREQQYLREKRLIALRALDFVPRRGTIYLDAGSTSMELAKALNHLSTEQRSGIRIVTHATNLATHLAETQIVSRIHQIGGDIDSMTLAATGPKALEQVGKLNFDIFFMGVSGADLVAGWSNNDASEAEIKKTVMQRSSKTYVIADSSKWGEVGFVPVEPLSAVDGWVVDAVGTDQIRGALAGIELQLYIAEG